MTHIMLDLETWGKRPGCDIRSIGAVVFDPVRGRVGQHTFYIATDNPTTPHEQYHCASCDSEWLGGDIPRYPLHRDPETVQWWNDQSPEAQAAFENPVDLREALGRFAEWYGNLCVEKNVYDITIGKLWANDPHFDVSILEAAFHAVGLSVPWHYRAPRSMKTATDLAGLPRDEYCNYGTGHHALHDAIAQAQTVCKCYARLGLVRASV